MHEILRFSRFEVHPLQRLLRVDGQFVTIGSRAFDILRALAQRPGELLSKQALMQAAWPRLVVEESNLTVQVSQLRKLLGATAIATIPGRGYRLAEVPSPATGEVDMSTLASDRLRSNLPRQLPALIGRDTDIDAVGALLASHRLVTLTGAGGIGKTRLAERLLHDRQRVYEHGVAWVELAALTDAEQLPGTLAAALGVQVTGADALQGLAAALAPLQMLVCLDNAEHVVEGLAATIPILLDSSAGLRLLVTSQTPLRVAEERAYRVDALSLPGADDPIDAALQSGAVRLFAERACATSQGTANAVGHSCARAWSRSA